MLKKKVRAIKFTQYWTSYGNCNEAGFPYGQKLKWNQTKWNQINDFLNLVKNL